MPIIHKPADAIRELVNLRTLHGKVFDLGGNKRRIIQKIGRVHYVDAAGQLQDIELEAVRDPAGDIVAHESLPYVFRLHRSGVGFDYRTKADASEISLRLDRIGSCEFTRERQYSVAVDGRHITFTDVDSGLDIVFALTRFGVRTYRNLKSEFAARSWRWQIECNELGESKLHKSTIAGEDAEGRGVEVVAKLGTAELLGDGKRRYFSEESWSGKVAKRDFKTRVKSWSDEVAYPVWIDPDITENIVADADDGHEKTNVSTWASNVTLDNLGKYNYYYDPAWRFQSVALPAAADLTSLDLAVLKINAVSSTFSGGGGKLYGYDVDDAAALSSTVRPSTMAKTTANTTVAQSTSTGIRSYTITTIVDEWAQRAGRVSGADFTIFGIGNVGTYNRTRFEDYSNGGTDEAQLEIDYTEAGGGGGTSGNILLLGCG